MIRNSRKQTVNLSAIHRVKAKTVCGGKGFSLPLKALRKKLRNLWRRSFHVSPA